MVKLFLLDRLGVEGCHFGDHEPKSADILEAQQDPYHGVLFQVLEDVLGDQDLLGDFEGTLIVPPDDAVPLFVFLQQDLIDVGVGLEHL